MYVFTLEKTYVCFYSGNDQTVFFIKCLIQPISLCEMLLLLSSCCSYIRELKHRHFSATDVNRKSKLLLFDAYYSLFIENVKL